MVGNGRVGSRGVVKPGHRFLEHMSDVYAEAWGPTLEEAYRQAALALYETLTQPGKVEPRLEKRVEARGEDLQELLYDWLEKLIILFDTEGFLARDVEVEEVGKHEGGWRLKATLRGEPYTPGKHPSGTHVKGVTYHLMEVKEQGEAKTLRFILDI